MEFARIQTIIDKEWAEVFKNRLVLFTVSFMPAMFTVIPLIILYATRSAVAAAGDVADIPPQFLEVCGNLPPGVCLQTYLISQFMVLFMVMPLVIPTSIAAYSIVGEKTTHSLEPLLATPITTVELLAAKCLAAVIPAILATWGGFIIFALAAPWAGGEPALALSIFSPMWLTAIFVAAPLMAVIAVNFAIIVSSRTTDPRVAEHVSAIIILPLLVMVFGQLAGVIVLNAQIMLATVAALAVIGVGLIYLGARLFQRETILTKWK